MPQMSLFLTVKALNLGTRGTLPRISCYFLNARHVRPASPALASPVGTLLFCHAGEGGGQRVAGRGSCLQRMKRQEQGSQLRTTAAGAQFDIVLKDTKSRGKAILRAATMF